MEQKLLCPKCDSEWLELNTHEIKGKEWDATIYSATCNAVLGENDGYREYDCEFFILAHSEKELLEKIKNYGKRGMAFRELMVFIEKHGKHLLNHKYFGVLVEELMKLL
jgi:hypothetical protein